MRLKFGLSIIPFALASIVASQKVAGSSCQKLIKAECKGLGYSETAMPNTFQHRMQEEAITAMNIFSPLIKHQCSPDARLFFCSLYVPQCSRTGMAVLPCRSLCETVKSDCQGIMAQHSLSWTRNFTCEMLPTDSEVCVRTGVRPHVLVSSTVSSAIFPERRKDAVLPRKHENLDTKFGLHHLTRTHGILYGNKKGVSLPSAGSLCEPISVLLCEDLPYNTTTMPNFFNHSTQSEASADIRQYKQLTTLECSSDFRLFLCTLYVPKCTESGTYLLPCRDICFSIRDRCGIIMSVFGFKWPDCNQLPVPSHEEQCISKLNERNMVVSPPASVRTDISSPLKTGSHGKCEMITIPLCKDLPYKTILNHTSQEKAEMKAHKDFPLLKMDFSLELQFFICSVYVPVCTGKELLYPPCQSLCNLAKYTFDEHKGSNNLSWPDSLQCSRFPNLASDIPCILDRTDNDVIISPATWKGSERDCQPVVVPLCRDLPYNTSFPNILNHDSQEEAGLAIHQFFPLIEVHCSLDLQLFLCSVYVPVCTESEEVMLPCKSLCQSARHGCEELMNIFGFSWPESLQCDRFPEPSYGQSCVFRVTESEVIISPSPSAASTQFPLTKIRSERDCEPILVPLCRDLPYNTSFPNIFNHDNQEDAGLEIHQFFPLIRMQCSLDLQLFLCSVYIPVCTERKEPILPCKSLCQSARHGCEEIMNRFGFSWPESLQCSRFPEPSDGKSCVSRVTDSELIISPSPPASNAQSPVTRIGSKRDCEPILLTLCRDLPYNTSFPNIFNHDSQEEAGLEIHQFVPLIRVQCSLDLQLFLCSVYVPVCTESEEPILPCRSLCQSARHGCEKLMNRFGFQWPGSLHCDRFPEPSFEQSCVLRVTESEVIISPSPPAANTQFPVTRVISKRECEPVLVPLCGDLPYNTSFPNIFNHDSQEEAWLEIHQFFPLIRMQCSLDLQLFLCSVYVPVCTEREKAVMPCKNLCQSARHGCEELMNEFGFPWPESLQCDRFPEPSYEQSCVSRVTENEVIISPSPSVASTQSRVTRIGSKRNCEPVVVPFCRDLPYNTSFPNIFSHDNQEEAGLEIHQFLPLIRVQCSLDLQLFLCSVYVPVCTESEEAMLPCKSLCQSARYGCEELMNRFGFSWPESLHCDRFPEPPNGQSCILQVTESEVIISPSPPAANTQSPVTRIGSVRDCEPILVPLCRDLPYSTSFPNIFDHDSQEEAGLEIHQFFPLIRMQCSLDLQLFLCSVYVPVCTEGEEPVLPCRSLCQSARHGCEKLMNRFGFPWPESLHCDRFPEPSFEQSCVLRVTESEVIISPSPPAVSTQSPVTRISLLRGCEPILEPLCRDLPYNTSFPNILNHDSQGEAGLEIHQFFPLIRMQCSIDLQLFLCSVYVPVCTEGEEPVLPCRSLCQSARHGCEELMNRFGFQWPGSLHCDRFPEPSFEQSCVLRVTESEVIISPSPPAVSTLSPVTRISSLRGCEPILVPLCRDLPYNTSFPNILNHDSQGEAGLEIHQFFPLIRMQCSLDLQLFLCSVYVPVCTEGEEPVLPCRNLCQSARHGCEKLMNRFGFPWPESLHCDRFPEPSFEQSCVLQVTKSEVIISPSPPAVSTLSPVTRISSLRDCEPILEPLCRDLPYNTSFPNILNHESQEEAGLEIHQFFPLIRMQCSLDLQLFLCSVYVPVCTEREKAMLPCRSLCQSARLGCEELMNRFGFSWPESLQCSRFPEPSDEDLCISAVSDKKIITMSRK
ncbi:uncharacterized protein [Macrobrachium rosenbergii]|uniref:uncharacterized protein n=1 Tax=Macrobrachium rosenbergii TaxID=79674 RepID=UPI0034D6B31E